MGNAGTQAKRPATCLVPMPRSCGALQCFAWWLSGVHVVCCGCSMLTAMEGGAHLHALSVDSVASILSMGGTVPNSST